jgi:hypothetical protein
METMGTSAADVLFVSQAVRACGCSPILTLADILHAAIVLKVETFRALCAMMAPMRTLYPDGSCPPNAAAGVLYTEVPLHMIARLATFA